MDAPITKLLINEQALTICVNKSNVINIDIFSIITMIFDMLKNFSNYNNYTWRLADYTKRLPVAEFQGLPMSV